MVQLYCTVTFYLKYLLQTCHDAVILYSLFLFLFGMEISYISINAFKKIFKCIHAGTLFFFNYTGKVYIVQVLYAAEMQITLR